MRALKGFNVLNMTSLANHKVLCSGRWHGILVYYSLFHQDLGVAFFQFARSLFKIFYQIFSQIIFSPSPNIPENLVDFFCVSAKLDHLACNNFQNDSSL